MRHTQIEVPLSRLIAGRRNPRRVKPAREAHQRLVALIRAHGLLQPLVVRPADDKPKVFQVIAGNRRLAALKEIHRDNGDPKIPCTVREVNTEVADALSLGENFAREAMHPLDEAEAFARLATGEGKDAKAIGAEFGTGEKYVRQRMKLATLARPLKAAYRESAIDTGIAEAFACVPEDRQLEIWEELGGNPRTAEQVRRVIANGWIDAANAVFDVSTLPDSAVARDLFNERVLIERQAFMEAQAAALEAQRNTLTDDGWSEVVIGQRDQVQDRLYSMHEPDREFDKLTEKKLAKISERAEKLNRLAEQCDDDSAKMQRLQQRMEALESEEKAIVDAAPECFTEETKSLATAFLILDPDGRVHREIRVPRPKHDDGKNGSDETIDGEPSRKPPTVDDMSDKQLAVTFTHQAIAVREALLNDEVARRRVLALILHPKARSEALSVRHDANGTTLLASKGEGFSSPAFDRLEARHSKLDPFKDVHFVEDPGGYEQLTQLSKSKLDALIDLLIVDCITAHLHRPTPLVQYLAQELKVNTREHWRPDAIWLSGFQKIQLAQLLNELTVNNNAVSSDRKKSELVEMLATMFSDAAEGKLADKPLEKRLNQWLPSNLRKQIENEPQSSSKQ